MNKCTKSIRLFLTSLGVFTVLVSCVVIARAITLLRAWRHDPHFDASLVVLLLGVLLAVGGGCLALRGQKYGTPGS